MASVNLLVPEVLSVSVSDPLQQIRVSNQGSNRIDLEVSQTPMPSVFGLRLGLEFLDNRFNDDTFLQDYLISNR